MTNKIYSHFSLALILFMQDAEAFAYDINEQFSIGGVLAVTSQCQDLSDASSSGNGCEWAVPFQP